ncbi:pYEATS domain-containing protein [Rhizobium wuzhouense]|uniref:Prokaryotic YEATS domain-containing protein n=1 Tax=Rhizobium wuzhouense TaxID=1986026 RepID=A0ABX5NV70_9HYPH|nr:pYEATS domain-containing protein [Rhizobium wuzhouense]PYB77070.1 hypothetical protein DMY87_01400 [Rhizobium wuzhouense]
MSRQPGAQGRQQTGPVEAGMETIWRRGMVALALIPILLLALDVGSRLLGGEGSGDGKLVDVYLKYLGAAFVALLLARVGPLLKGKFYGVEVEFGETKLVADATMKATADVAALREELERVKDTLSRIAPPEGSTKKSLRAAPLPTPELGPVKVWDDPNKGRFGGLAEKDGFRLAAEFIGAEEARLVNVKLTVQGTDKLLTQKVRFFLHPTFPSPELTVNPMDGTASLDTLAYGGFTVGAWIEGTKTLLELDLSRADGAPRIIRDL